MKATFLAISAICLLFTACEKAEDRVLIEETRPKTSKDGDPRMFASSDERFRDTKPSPIAGNPPENWLKLPASPMRVSNYRFGESGLGEVYASLSSGGVQENVNRWLKQFSLDALGAEEFAAMETLDVAGTKAVWVEAEGTYDPGMGREAKPGYGLAGIISEVNGRILTVKMLGPKPEVEAEKDRLRMYLETLELTGN
ncbi:MAG: hypothetical protein AB8D78_01840 [Akkermansiaceae bacterium]